jgi:hypothetical protein
MQDFLTAAIEITAIAFISLMIVDFAQGLLSAFAAARPETNKPAIESHIALAPQVEETSGPQVEPAIAPQKVVTLDWVIENMPAPEVYAYETPDVIAMAKAKLPKIAPAPVQLATRQELIDLGIRRCKKLASQLKVCRYNVMKLSELADVLVGKIAVSDLAA